MHSVERRRNTDQKRRQSPQSTHPRGRDPRTILGLAACCAAMAFPALAADSPESNKDDTHTVTVIFENVTAPKEMIWASLCTKAQYAKLGEEPCMMNARVNAAEGAAITFEDVPSGVYAISAFHDTNGNQRLDFNSRGIPDEPTGNSGNARGFFGPPRFNQMKFTLSEATAGEEITIVIAMMGYGS